MNEPLYTIHVPSSIRVWFQGKARMRFRWHLIFSAAICLFCLVQMILDIVRGQYASCAIYIVILMLYALLTFFFEPYMEAKQKQRTLCSILHGNPVFTYLFYEDELAVQINGREEGRYLYPTFSYIIDAGAYILLVSRARQCYALDKAHMSAGMLSFLQKKTGCTKIGKFCFL